MSGFVGFLGFPSGCWKHGVMFSKMWYDRRSVVALTVMGRVSLTLIYQEWQFVLVLEAFGG